jgi:histone acetyltransferase (RNA polymerase elongator complex component)
MKRFIIPIFVSHKGCRQKCIFCNQYNIAGNPYPAINIRETIISHIDTQLKKFGKINPKYEKTQISFYGGSFTCLPKKIMLKYFNIACKFLKHSNSGEIEDKYKVADSLRLSTRPDCIDEETADFLLQNSVKTVEIGAQTLDNELLEILNRGHSLQHLIDAVKVLRKYNFETGIQLMVGVPRETKKKLEKMSELLIDKLKPNFVRIYPLIVIKGTAIEKMYNNGEYQPLSVDEAVKRTLIIAKKCVKNNIEIARIGLQQTENLSETVVAGPALPNIGEIVRQQLYN